MKGGTFPMAILASLGLLAAAGAGVVAVLGSSPDVMRGTAAGLVLGWLGSGLELRLMQPHIHSDFPKAQRILTLGFGVRLFAILAAAMLLEGGGLADASAFGASLVVGFLCFLPVLAVAVRPPLGNGEARG